jgi:UDP-glucuronate decarboxylase
MDIKRTQYPYLEDILLISSKELSSMAGSTVLITGGYGMLLSYSTLAICLFNSRNPKNKINLILIVKDAKKAINKLSSFEGFEYVKLIESNLAHDIIINTRVDYIIHGAGYGSPRDYLDKIDLVFKSNILGTYNLLNLASEKNVKSFLNISSGAVYGDNYSEEIVDEIFLGEVNYNSEKNFYSETKRFSEMISNVHSFSGTISTLRPAHIYGPTMDLKNDNRIICSFINNILSKKPLEIHSDGNDKRSFCHVADFTNGLLKVLLNGTSGEKYNIGNDDMYMSINELAETISMSIPGVSIKYHKNREVRRTNKMLMVSQKLNALGWAPNISIKDGFISTLEYYNSL